METWEEIVKYFQTNEFQELQTYIVKERENGKEILPQKSDVFKALNLTPLYNVKVVILGQDPYPNPQHAHGLAFSIPKTTKDVPKSLKNILKELETDLGIKAKSANLENWAKQGVLLLNTVLTVEKGLSNSHHRIGWRPFTTEIIKTVNEEVDHCVFILWGRQAQEMKKLIDTQKHLIIESPHPSPLSAYRGFFGSKPFSKSNTYLSEHGIEPINWNI